jgi:DNA-binding GntR family transcriptional regulator
LLTQSDRAFEAIEAAIVSGEIPLGSKIREEEFAARIGVSRGPLREALSRLAGRRLVVRHPRTGSRVVSLTREDLIEIYEMREMLEGLAARRAAEHMTDAEIAGVRQELDRHFAEERLKSDDSYLQSSGDRDFHYRIAAGSASGRLQNLLCGDLYSLIRLCRFRTANSRGRALRAYRDHERILDAIADRDGELAEILMRRHVAAARKLFFSSEFKIEDWRGDARAG